MQSARIGAEEHLQDGNRELYKGIYTAVRNHRDRNKREGEEGTWCLKEWVRAERGDREGTSEGFCPCSEGTPPVLRTPRQKTVQNCLLFYAVENE